MSSSSVRSPWGLRFRRLFLRIACPQPGRRVQFSNLGLLGVGATRSSLARRLLAAEAAGYVLAALAFAVAASRRRNERLRMVPGIALVFPTFHLGYGIGLLRGIFAGDRARGAVRKPRRGRASA
jgi:hypothetical protein